MLIAHLLTTVTKRIIPVPLRRDAFRQELTCFFNWYNQSRPQTSLHGKTPHEVYHDVLSA